MKIGANPFIQARPPIDPITKAKLDQLGLKPTGSREGDLAAIQNALTGQAEKTGEQKGPQNWPQMPPPKTPDEIASFMQKLGLNPTNSKEGDHAAITTKLATLETIAKTDSEKQNVNTLKGELKTLIESVQGKQPPPPEAMTGMQQLGLMNKFFMVK